MKYDVKVWFRGLPGDAAFEGIEARNKLEAEVRGQHMAEICNPGRKVLKVKATLSSVRLKREARLRQLDAALANGPETWRRT